MSRRRTRRRRRRRRNQRGGGMFDNLYNQVKSWFGRTKSSGWSYTNSLVWTYKDYLEGITYGNSIFVTVGRGEDGSGTIMTSSDGINWTSRTSGTTNNLWFVTYKE